MQAMFTRLEQLHPDLFNLKTQEGRDFVNEFHAFIEQEKEQVINAFNMGRLDNMVDGETFYRNKYSLLF